MDLMRLCLTAFHGGLLAFVVGFTAVPAAAQGTFCARLTDPVLTAPGPERIEGTEPFVYRATPTGVLRLHVLRPAAETSTGAAVIGISMGGWMSGNVANFMPNARLLAARGVTVIMPDIRSWCRDGANIVDQVVDSKAAVRWVRSHAVELGIDPARIAVAGGSSAGHLALSTAMFAEIDAAEERVTKSRPDLLLLFFPCVDPTSEIEQAVSEPAIGTRGAEVSPLLHLAAGLPPTIILQGTDDPLLDNVREFCRRSGELGNSCDYHEYAGAKHGFMRQGQDHYEEGFAALLAFLERRGFASPERS
jgi:acetyl esterase/lipase